MEFLVMGGLLLILFLFVYPAIVASVKVNGVREQVARLEQALAQMPDRLVQLERPGQTDHRRTPYPR